jgi:2-C-methyl-D-erythritol 4-phosphate cytidylyltransferase
MSVAALLLAAGRGERLRHPLPKALALLAGSPLVVRSLRALAASPQVEWIVPVVPGGAVAAFEAALAGEAGERKLAPLVVGGAERQDSMAAGLAALPPGIELVAVHDAARPLVRPEDVTRVIDAAAQSGAAILAVPARDTVKRVRGGAVVETPPRDECYSAQTPQVFRADLLREALAKARAERVVATDDSALVERLGVRVTVVSGDPHNLKITGPEDLAWAEALLSAGRP